MSTFDETNEHMAEHYLDGEADAPPDAMPATQADRIRDALLTTADVKTLQPPEAIIDGILYRDSLAMIYGPSGVGKTLLGIDIAQHVAYGSWWHGREVTGGPVLYVAAEGASAFGQRLEAWEQHHRLWHEQHPVRWMPHAINVFDSSWSKALAEVVADLAPTMVVLDTFARCATGAEENSARDVGQVVANLDRVRRAAGSCVLLVHHAGKDGSAGARGSSALRAAMDTELELTGEPSRLRLATTKQKNAAEAEPILLALKPVAESVVVDQAAGVDPDSMPAKLAATLESLAAVDVPGGVSTATWRVAAEAADRTFYRHLSRLVGSGLVVNVGTEKTPRYRAKHVTDATTGAPNEKP